DTQRNGPCSPSVGFGGARQKKGAFDGAARLPARLARRNVPPASDIRPTGNLVRSPRNANRTGPDGSPCHHRTRRPWGKLTVFFQRFTYRLDSAPRPRFFPVYPVHLADPAPKAVRAIVRTHLDAAVEAAGRLSRSADPEALHDVRVAIRRLRVVLKA